MLVYPQTRKITRTAQRNGCIFQLVEAPSPTPGERKIVLGNTALSRGYAIENRSLKLVCSQKIYRQNRKSRDNTTLNFDRLTGFLLKDRI